MAIAARQLPRNCGVTFGSEKTFERLVSRLRTSTQTATPGITPFQYGAAVGSMSTLNQPRSTTAKRGQPMTRVGENVRERMAVVRAEMFRAWPRLPQMDLLRMPTIGRQTPCASASRSADRRRRHRFQRVCRAHLDQPLHRPPAVPLAGECQRAAVCIRRALGADLRRWQRRCSARASVQYASTRLRVRTASERLEEPAGASCCRGVLRAGTTTANPPRQADR